MYPPPPLSPYPPPMFAPMIMGPKRSSGVLTAAGVLNIINAVIAFIFGSIIMIGGGTRIPFDVTGTMAGLVLLCGGAFLLGGASSLLAGIYCLKRRSFGMCVLGSLLGMFLAIAFGIGFILGLIAVILVFVGKDDFLDRAPQSYAPLPGAMMPPYPVYQPMMPPPGGQWKFCSSCGTQVSMFVAACPNCGVRV